MQDEAKTYEQVLAELNVLRKRVAERENEPRQRIPAEDLRASDKRYRDIFDNAPVGIFRTTPDGRLLDANRVLSRMLGYRSPQELIETTNRTSVPEALYIDPDLRANLVVNKALANKGEWEKAEVRLRRSDDKIITVWLYFRAVSGEEPAAIEGFCEDISERLRAEDALRSQGERLQEANTALKVLLKRREEDRTELEESLLKNVKHLIMPYLEKLKRSRLTGDQGNLLEILESHLREITSPFVHKVSAPMLGLTPTEIRVADLIRQGRSSKEIAELLGISERAAIFHRQGIREKLGLTGKKLNLQTYLSSFQ